MEPEGAGRRLAAIMFTDIVGYTALMAEDEARGLQARERHRSLVGPLVERYHGLYIEDRGDETFCSFSSALDAVNCALAVQATLAEDPELQLRVGIHQGDVTFDAGGVYGDGVNVASRIRELAGPGEICVSDEVQHSVQNQSDIQTQALGKRELKNVPRTVFVYTVTGTAGAPRPVARTAWQGRSRLGVSAAALVALLVGVGLGAWWLNRPIAALGPVRSIAVLPLENLSGDSEEYFADGMTEALTAELSKLADLRVISRTSVMGYKGTTMAVQRIATELNVDAVVEGSVMRADGRVRITAQLIDARSDDHLWAESYERELSEVLKLQREVAREIARRIEQKVAPAHARPNGARPIDPRAHQAYLKGLYFSQTHTPQASLKSVEHLEEAIRLDPGYALAYSTLADIYSCTPTHAWSMHDSELWSSVPQAVMAKARVNAVKAIELDPTLGEAHNALALVRVFADWDWEGAERGFKKAIDLKPNLAWARQTYGLFLAAMGRLDESLAQMKLSVELDPLNVQAYIFMGEIHSWRGEYEEAVDWWESGLELNPAYPDLHQSLAASLCQRGLVDRPVDMLRKATARFPDDPLILADLGYCYGVTGRTTEAREILRELEALSQRTYVSPITLALVHTGLGETDSAFESLELAYRDRAFFLPWLNLDAQYNPLRSDPRFDDLLRRIGIPES